MLIDSIKQHEGFINHVYKDSLDFDTIGYGTKMPITEEEATLLLQHRLNLMVSDLISKEPYYNELPQVIADVIAEMAYQMGVNGVLSFKKMWEALKKKDYKEAAKQGLDSKWYIQTPERAKKLMSILENYEG